MKLAKSAIAVTELVIRALERDAPIKTAHTRGRIYRELKALGVDVEAMVDGERQSYRQALFERLRRARSDRSKADIEAEIAATKRRDLHFQGVPSPLRAAKEDGGFEGYERASSRAIDFPISVTEWEAARAGRRETPARPLKKIDAIERMSRMLTAEHVEAAQAIRYLYDQAHANPKGSSYGMTSGGGTPENRLALTPQAERAGREWNAIWTHTSPEIRVIITNFILEIPDRRLNRPLSLEEFGLAFGSIKPPKFRTSAKLERARGISEAALKLALCEIAETRNAYHRWIRAGRPAPPPGRFHGR